MSDCPVCETTFIKGKSDRCHVCGWQLNASGFSMIGPVKIEHQLSRTTLTQIEAWAHHMWTTIQQQKKQITRLQTQQRSPQISPQALPTVKLPQAKSAGMMMTPTETDAIAPSPNPSTTPSELLQWVLSRLETAEEERSQLKFQVSQLRAQLQRQTEAVPPHQPPLLPEAITADDPAWQSSLERVETQIQHAQVTGQQQIHEAIAPLMSTHQMQQQTLLALQNTVQTLQYQLQDQSQTLQNTQQQVITLTPKVAAPALAPITHRLEALEDQARSLPEQLTTLETQLTTHVQEQIAPLQAQMQQTRESLPDFSQQLQTLKQQLQIQHNQAIQYFQERINQVQQTCQQLQTELEQPTVATPPPEHQALLTTQQAQIEALMAQVQALEAAVEESSSAPVPTSIPGLESGRSSHKVYTRYH